MSSQKREAPRNNTRALFPLVLVAIMSTRTGRSFELIATAIDISVLAVAAVLTLQLFRKLDGVASSKTVSSSKETAEKVKKLAAKLKSRAQDGNPLRVHLKEHELEVASDVVAPDEIDVTFADVGGLAEVGKALQRNVILPFTRPELFKQSSLLKPPRGILLHGPPGTGKTLLARAVAREAKFTFIALNPAWLLSKWYGESNKLADSYFSLAHKLAPSIIFIDEIDCLFRHRSGGGPAGGGGGDGEHEATAMLKAQFLSLWDGLLTSASSQVVVIAATNRPDSVDPAVLRRLPLSYRIDLPALDGRLDVLRLLLKDEPLAKEVDLTAVAAATEGYSGSDLHQLCKTAAFRSLEEALEMEAAAEKEYSANTPGGHAVANASVTKPAGWSSVSIGSRSYPGRANGQAGGSSARGGTGGSTGGDDVDETSPATETPPTEPRGPEPLISLRQLTLDDFLAAREVVRPTRGRFAGVTHDVYAAAPPVPVAGGYDDELYD